MLVHILDWMFGYIQPQQLAFKTRRLEWYLAVATDGSQFDKVVVSVK